jgi:hypothetical protein
MTNAKQWAVGLTILAALAGATIFQTRHHKIEVVEVKSELDLSKILPGNPGCKITGSNGTALDVTKLSVIPEDTLITSECFGRKK